MRRALLRHIAVYLCYARLTVQAQLQDPLYLTSWLFLVSFHWLASAYVIKVLADTFNGLAGWTFGQLMFIYGLGLVSHGLTITLFSQAWSIGDLAIRGEFDRLLVRPVNVYLHFVGSFLNLIGVFDLIPGIVILLYGCRETRFAWTMANALKLLTVIVSAVMIRVAVHTATGSIAFWTGRSRAPLVLVSHLMERTTMYPLNFYPQWLQVFLTFLIPAGFVSFYPACDFFGRADAGSLPLGLALWTPLVGTAVLAAAYFLFSTGLAHWDTTGS